MSVGALAVGKEVSKLGACSFESGLSISARISARSAAAKT